MLLAYENSRSEPVLHKWQPKTTQSLSIVRCPKQNKRLTPASKTSQLQGLPVIFVFFYMNTDPTGAPS